MRNEYADMYRFVPSGMWRFTMCDAVRCLIWRDSPTYNAHSTLPLYYDGCYKTPMNAPSSIACINETLRYLNDYNIEVLDADST